MKIEEVLPHREPFLFVDDILEQEYLKYAKGIKMVLDTEPWTKGHFPENPVFPGVLLLELMAQVGGFVFVNEAGSMKDNKFAYLTKVDNLRLKKKVIPGDIVEVTATFVDSFMNYSRVCAKSYVKNRMVAEAEITYTFMNSL